MRFRILAMRPEDLREVRALWESSEGMGLSEADTPGGIARTLARNPDLSLVAREGDALVGAVLCGHDGRRGFLHHLAVRSDRRRQGIGRALVGECLARLSREGIQKCHVFVYGANRGAIAFWERTGWVERGELVLLSRTMG